MLPAISPIATPVATGCRSIVAQPEFPQSTATSAARARSFFTERPPVPRETSDKTPLVSMTAVPPARPVPCKSRIVHSCNETRPFRLDCFRAMTLLGQQLAVWSSVSLQLNQSKRPDRPLLLDQLTILPFRNALRYDDRLDLPPLPTKIAVRPVFRILDPAPLSVDRRNRPGIPAFFSKSDYNVHLGESPLLPAQAGRVELRHGFFLQRAIISARRHDFHQAIASSHHPSPSSYHRLKSRTVGDPFPSGSCFVPDFHRA